MRLRAGDRFIVNLGTNRVIFRVISSNRETDECCVQSEGDNSTGTRGLREIEKHLVACDWIQMCKPKDIVPLVPLVAPIALSKRKERI